MMVPEVLAKRPAFLRHSDLIGFELPTGRSGSMTDARTGLPHTLTTGSRQFDDLLLQCIIVATASGWKDNRSRVNTRSISQTAASSTTVADIVGATTRR
jgi:hypothetical protein